MRNFVDDADRMGIMVKQVQSLLGQAMDRDLRPLGLSVPQYACLRALCEVPGLSGSELARRVFVSRQSMNGVVLGLEKRGLIARPSDKSHGRTRQAEVTSDGLAVLNDAEERVADTVHSMIRDVPESELKVTLGVLDRLSANLTAER